MDTSGPGSSEFPPAPWEQRGEAWLRLQSLEAARLSVPPPFSPVVLPGKRCPGGLVLARYGEGSTLRYHELFQFCLVRQGARVGAWLPWLYVDHPASRSGGRALWGLPKRLAAFDWRSSESGHEVTLGDSSGELCRLTLSKGGSHGLPLPLLAPLFSQRAGRSLCLWPRGSARASRARLLLSFPAGSLLADSGLEGGPAWHLDALKLHMPGAR